MLQNRQCAEPITTGNILNQDSWLDERAVQVFNFNVGNLFCPLQTDIIAVRTPQIEHYKFLNVRKSHTDVDTSDSDHTKLDSCRSSPPRVRSPRPMTLPGVGDTGQPKKQPPRGSDIPGMPESVRLPSPPGPRHVRSYASNIVEGLLSTMVTSEARDTRGVDTCDEVTDISMSCEVPESKHTNTTVQ